MPCSTWWIIQNIHGGEIKMIHCNMLFSPTNCSTVASNNTLSSHVRVLATVVFATADCILTSNFLFFLSNCLRSATRVVEVHLTAAFGNLEEIGLSSSEFVSLMMIFLFLAAKCQLQLCLLHPPIVVWIFEVLMAERCHQT